MNTETSFETVPVWKNVSAELSAELTDLWGRSKAIPHPDQAVQRARQAVCVARDQAGAVCGVGTAVIRVLPRLRQPLYYYRQFFAPEFRGQKQALPFFNEARRLLQEYNDSLPAPESLGVLLELESQQLVARYERAFEPAADSTFIGYSPRGLQLRVSYFDNARLLPWSLQASAP
ncbi:MAG TPA: hypothetical protein VGD21_16560 [Lysobacter sp.]